MSNILFGDTLFIISGPCAIENKETPFLIAKKVKTLCEKYGFHYIFKASYRKANRSSLHSFTGIGDKEALSILGQIRDELGVPVTTDIHTEEEAAIAGEYADILQIPAFLCRQTSLLLAAANTGIPVNIKKGQFMSADSMKFAVEKVKSKNNNVLVTERGTSFGYQDLVVDYRSIPLMQAYTDAVVMDCTHSLQRPNQSSGVTGGNPEMIATIAKAAVAVGANGLFIETHPDPANAKSDGANMLHLDKLDELLSQISKIRKAVT